MKVSRITPFFGLLIFFSPVARPQRAAVAGTSTDSQQQARTIEDQRFNEVIAGLDAQHRKIWADWLTDKIACGNDSKTNQGCLKAAAQKRDKQLALNDQLRAEANALHANQIDAIYRHPGDVISSVGGGNPTGTPVDGTPAGGDPGGIPGGTSAGRSNPNGNPGIGPGAGGTRRNPGGNNGNTNGPPTNSPGGSNGNNNGSPTNSSRGNPGCTITMAQNQSLRSTSWTDYLLTGTYGVYQGAWNSGGPRVGSAQISKTGSPGMLKMQTPQGTAMMTYCSTVGGNPVFVVGGRKVRFNRLQVPGNGLVVYDVWWLNAQNEQNGTPETWTLGQ